MEKPEPVKQFFNQKTQQWHVLGKNPESKNGLSIISVQPLKVKELPVCGEQTKGYASEPLPDTLSEPELNKDDDSSDSENLTFGFF